MGTDFCVDFNPAAVSEQPESTVAGLFDEIRVTTCSVEGNPKTFQEKGRLKRIGPDKRRGGDGEMMATSIRDFVRDCHADLVADMCRGAWVALPLFQEPGKNLARFL